MELLYNAMYILFSQTFLWVKMLKKILTPVKGVTEHFEYNYHFPKLY